jgi:Zn-finger nucleic acid-binding protein
MQCPLCTIKLSIYHRQGIDVDYCPKCRGGWLGRGELDKYLEKYPIETEDKSMPLLSNDRNDSTQRIGFHGYPKGRRFTNIRNRSLLRDLYDD